MGFGLFFSLKLRLWIRRWFSRALGVLEDLKLDFSARVKSQESRLTSVTLALAERGRGRSQEFVTSGIRESYCLKKKLNSRHLKSTFGLRMY